MRSRMPQFSEMRQGGEIMDYLGVPLLRGAPKALFLRPIANKVLRMVDAWKGLSLSYVGGNSVIMGALNYYFQVYKWLSSLLKLLDSSIRNLLWSGDPNSRKKNCCFLEESLFF